MHAITKICFVLMFTSISFCVQANTVDHHWKMMQQSYNQLCHQLSANKFLSLEKQYCHVFWFESKEQLKAFILEPIGQNFTAHPVIASTMVKVWNNAREYEACYLKNCLSGNSKELLAQFCDTGFTGLAYDCKDFNCSANTLGHLFYAFKVLEQCHGRTISTIVEFGAGYGNLARCFKTMLPQTTIILIDLPELLALQYFFLTSCVENTDVIMHVQPPLEFKQGAIHLVPVYYLKNLTFKADVFISSFALTEAPEIVQQIVIDNRFYNAQICFIDGQLEGNTIEWVKPALLQNAIRNQYGTIIVQPSHVLQSNVPSYEIMGLQNS